MQYFLQIVVTSLQSVSLAVFQPWFLLILYLVYWMYKKIIIWHCKQPCL